MTTNPPTDPRTRIVAAIKTSPFEELRTVGYAPNGPLEITIRVEELADAILRAVPAAVSVPPPTRAALHQAADIAEDVAESLRKHHEFERSTGALDVMTELRRMAAEAQQQPETCGQTRSVDGTEYPPCARPAGHEEAYCRSADGSAYFLATEAQAAPRREPHPTEADLRHAQAVLDRFHGRAAAAPVVPVQPAAADSLTPVGGVKSNPFDYHPEDEQQPAAADTREDPSNAICVCGHTRAEHLRIGGPFGRGRLLCDSCDPDSTENLVCEGFDAL